MKVRFHQCDVFTDRLFGGNPLVVTLGADGLAERRMQAFAREMNCSETTFVLPARDPNAAYRVRIFTPGQELPFAGHPTIGTAWTLHRLGLLNAETFAFEMEVGLVPVRRDGSQFWMTPPRPRIGDAVAVTDGIASALGLRADQLIGAPQSIGHFLCIPVRDRVALAALEIDRTALREPIGRERADGDLLCITFEDGHADVRMFADLRSGIGEDPATGSAVAPMLHKLTLDGRLTPTTTQISITQGEAIQRKSTLHASLQWKGALLDVIEVGGTCVHAFSSEMELR
ncbi:MAG TPA: PhzF family phenazine biosynthesis protein [Candidatus Dormibacteraeota bacterium]|nr:PhzF family phenazine biosynthesis protein [Candidatus Dormibacteraeota bacterium]